MSLLSIIILKNELISYSLILEIAEKRAFTKEDTRICAKRLNQSRLLILMTSLAYVTIQTMHGGRTTAIPLKFQKPESLAMYAYML